jgi:hypothetical protein
LLKYIVFFISIAQFPSYAGDLENYMAQINNSCEGVNLLIVKKSLIELTVDQSCNSSFTLLLLKNCPNLNCQTLIKNWASFNTSRPGAVIGK